MHTCCRVVGKVAHELASSRQGAKRMTASCCVRRRPQKALPFERPTPKRTRDAAHMMSPSADSQFACAMHAQQNACKNGIPGQDRCAPVAAVVLRACEALQRDDPSKIVLR